LDRQIVYPSSIPLDTDILNVQRNTMIALGFLTQATFGTSTAVNGLACTPQTVPNLTFNVGPGSIATLSTVDANAFGSLPADNTDALVKLGVNIAPTQFTVTAPTTSGQSINYLVQAAFQESDATAVVLPYYNSANPAVSYSGPSNSGAAQNTQRLQRVNLGLKAGSPASTGSQVTPTPDSGFVGLWVVTVAYAATTVVSGNIALYPLAPFIGGGSVKPGRLINVQIFTASGLYVPTSGMESVIVEGAGGGAGCGGCAATSSTQNAIVGGGGSGAYGKGQFSAASVGSSQTVTIGTAGAAGTAGANAGGNGGTTSFGALMSMTGGIGSAGGPAVAVSGGGTAAGGSGGGTIAGGGIESAVGGVGATGVFTSGAIIIGGSGGASRFGGTSNSATVSTTTVSNAAVPGGSPGAGASGGSNNTSCSAIPGAVGGVGKLIAWEFS
jgi:hypothetical protein